MPESKKKRAKRPAGPCPVRTCAERIASVALEQFLAGPNRQLLVEAIETELLRDGKVLVALMAKVKGRHV